MTSTTSTRMAQPLALLSFLSLLLVTARSPKNMLNDSLSKRMKDKERISGRRTTSLLEYGNFRFLAGVYDDECKFVGDCELCDSQARADIAECAKTGRVQRMTCEIETETTDVTSENNTQTKSLSTEIRHQSCNRTTADDEFLMVRMQVICVLVGSFAFATVRRQRQATASLFDQRKQREAAKAKARQSTISKADVEMIQFGDETIPLTADDEVDVI